MHRASLSDATTSICFLSLFAACIPSLGAACAPRVPVAPALIEETVTFQKAPPKVGRVAIYENTSTLLLGGKAQTKRGGSAQMVTETTVHEKWREEIVAVFDRVVTKKKVTYESMSTTEAREGAPLATVPNVLSGHAYSVELSHSVLVLKDAAGRDVEGAEHAELTRRHGNLGRADPFLEGIPNGPVRPHQAASGMAGGFLEMIDGDDGADIGNVDVRFVGSREHEAGRAGVFAFVMAVQMAGRPSMHLDLKGEFLVRIGDTAPLELDMSGPVELVDRQNVEGENVQLNATGEIHSKLRIHYPSVP
ncbi:MAG TPA: hypothetical protein VJT73_07565 [Polyangiaceae bacterium]|nr:hypothetical protein [Polyangiaceae bacterium]